MQRAAVLSPQPASVRRLVLFGTPLVLIGLELGHPLLDHANPIAMLAPIAVWWIILHILLIPFFVLQGYAFFLLLQGIESWAATLGRFAVMVFISFEIGYDTAVGLTSGIFVSNASTLPLAQQNVIQQALHQLYYNPAIFLSYYILLVFGVVAICAAVWSLYRVGVPRLPLLVFLGTLLTAYSHALPYGPLGSACFLVSVVWIELAWHPSPKQNLQPIA